MLVILSSVLFWLGVVGVRLGVGGEARQGEKAKQVKAREGRIGQGEAKRAWTGQSVGGRWPR